MWLLFIIVLTPYGHTEMVIEQYRTEQLCSVEKVRIELEMHKSYPKDHDFRFVCRKKGLIT